MKHAFSLYNKCLEVIPGFFVTFFNNLMTNNLTYSPITRVGLYYSINLQKKIPENTMASMLDKYARAFYFEGKEPAYLISNGRKVYLIPELE